MADTAPWLLVGLGNPGSGYAKNRHNVGFMVVDEWCDDAYPRPSWRERWSAQVTSLTDPERGGRVVAVKPQTYMNRSGESVQPAAHFHQVPPERILVVHDELDFDFGRLALKVGGGHGGHNGLRDLISRLGTRDFLRLRFGIGRPRHGDVSKWVLSDFADDDAAQLPDLLDAARKAVTTVFTKGVKQAMNIVNTTAAPA